MNNTRSKTREQPQNLFSYYLEDFLEMINASDVYIRIHKNISLSLFLYEEVMECQILFLFQYNVYFIYMLFVHNEWHFKLMIWCFWVCAEVFVRP